VVGRPSSLSSRARRVAAPVAEFAPVLSVESLPELRLHCEGGAEPARLSVKEP